MNQATTLLFIILSVTLNSFAQIIWKKGADKGFKKAKIKDLIHSLLDTRIIAGLILYGTSAIIWILVLSNTEVSYAYPFISLAYVTTTFLSWSVLKERIDKKKIIGLVIIIIGVIIVGASL